MGLFGENFPYTNFHNLNLDWLIRVLKDLDAKYPQLLEELENKLEAPAAAGSTGQFLVNIGNGKTKWEDLTVEIVPYISNAVANWLEEHPEATTTVQDSTLTLAKFTEETAYKTTVKQSGLLSPVYIGDYLQDGTMMASAVCYVNGYMYCVDAKTDDYAIEQGDGIGTVRKYSIEDNELVAAYNVLVGHGNSIAFDGTYFYIAPIWEYSQGIKTTTSKVYRYSSSFVFISEVNAPSTIMGVSFDETTASLYALDYSGNIYKLGETEFEPYSTITNWSDFYNNENILQTSEYNQDIAIYNNNFYISSPMGNILHGLLKYAYSTITDFMQTSRYDITGRLVLGELEGYEFNEGHLYAIMYTILPAEKNNAFVVELPVNQNNCTSSLTGGDFTVKDFTLTLSATTKTRFSLKTYEIRSILQLFVRRLTAITQVIEIPTGENITEDYEIYLPNGNYELHLLGGYTCKKFVVSSGEFVIYAGTNNKLTLTDTGSLITLRRAGHLRIVGETLNTSTPHISSVANNFISFGYFMPLTIIRSAITNDESIDLYIGSAKMHDYEMYLGATPIIFMPNSFAFHQATGYISGSAEDMHLIFRLPKAIRGNLALTGSFTARGNKGYLDNVSTARDLSNFTITYWKPDDWTVEVVIKKNPAEAFTNCDNNTPVFANGTFTFTWS